MKVEKQNILLLPGVDIVAENYEALLVREKDGALMLVDIIREEWTRLEAPTFATGLGLLHGNTELPLGLYRDGHGEIIAFCLGPKYVATLIDLDQQDWLPRTAAIWATPTLLRMRSDESVPWATVLSQIPWGLN